MAPNGGSEIEKRPLKRRRTDSPPRHAPQHYQKPPAYTEPALQDETVIQGQMLKCISTSLAIAGFDSVLPSALEAFRAEAEEYMLHLLSTVKQSMNSSRRIYPTQVDFETAFTNLGIDPSSLEPHLELSLPEPIISTRLPRPDPPPPAPVDLAPMLGSELAGLQQRVQQPYIPQHFPALPSRHAWQSTAVFTEREKDARKIRERATQEGILAEQALRKLTASNKPRIRSGGAREEDLKREKVWQDTLGSLLDEGGNGEGDSAFGGSFATQATREDGQMAETLRTGGGMMVNHDRGHWRRGAPMVR